MIRLALPSHPWVHPKEATGDGRDVASEQKDVFSSLSEMVEFAIAIMNLLGYSLAACGIGFLRYQKIVQVGWGIHFDVTCTCSKSYM